MKQILFATVAAAAFLFPALAQTTQVLAETVQLPHKAGRHVANKMTVRSNARQALNTPEGTTGDNQMQTIQLINPMQLTGSQVRQVQRALDKKGFDVSKVDGIWGPETAAVVQRFQQRNGIDAHGHLARQTLVLLGVNWASSH